jgi:hypothetical protein
MGPTRRALLIGSRYKGLNGPENDINTMSRVLGALGFQITRCFDHDATRNGIRKAWEELIESIHDTHDTVVVYFSGHGGLLEPPHDAGVGDKESGNKTLRDYQFIVPTDFDRTTTQDFRGLLSIEISHLLQDTTKKTQNVTVILDCCHASHMARDPGHVDAAFPRNIELDQEDIAKYVEHLHLSGRLQEATSVEGNPHAVRIAASAPWESAWEYRSRNGVWVGAFTEAIAAAIEEAAGREVTWRTTILRVCEIVNVLFPGQHPRVEGPDTRLHFSLRQDINTAHLIRKEGELAVIHTGRVAGAREGSIYAVMPFGSETSDSGPRIAKATIVSVNGFRAEVDLDPVDSIPKEGALAFPLEEALYRWPVAFPEDSLHLRKIIEKSQYIRCSDNDDEILVEFKLCHDQIDVFNQQGVQIASLNRVDSNADEIWFRKAVKAAEQIAKVQHLLSLRCEYAEETLNHSVNFGIFLVRDRKLEKKLKGDGTDKITETESICIHLQNNGSCIVYASVFAINVAGKINLISTLNPKGIKLTPASYYTIGENMTGLVGLRITWPADIPKTRPIKERLVCVLSSAEVDLRQFNSERGRSGRRRQSTLEAMIDYVAFDDGRDVTCKELDSSLKYDVLHFTFLLVPKGDVEIS